MKDILEHLSLIFLESNILADNRAVYLAKFDIISWVFLRVKCTLSVCFFWKQVMKCMDRDILSTEVWTITKVGCVRFWLCVLAGVEFLLRAPCAMEQPFLTGILCCTGKLIVKSHSQPCTKRVERSICFVKSIWWGFHAFFMQQKN